MISEHKPINVWWTNPDKPAWEELDRVLKQAISDFEAGKPSNPPVTGIQKTSLFPK